MCLPNARRITVPPFVLYLFTLLPPIVGGSFRESKAENVFCHTLPTGEFFVFPLLLPSTGAVDRLRVVFSLRTKLGHKETNTGYSWESPSMNTTSLPSECDSVLSIPVATSLKEEFCVSN